MAASPIPAYGRDPQRPRLHALIEQVQAPLSWKSQARWQPYLISALVGVAAAIQGRQWFGFYLGVLVVIVAFQEYGERRTRSQLDVIVQIMRELEKTT